ncbi:MAG: electron transfer flavoprotein subunit alpha/FixB family protein [candidate division NC10 bacterium]|nr:electron transfer flavoprotein subunit alpha/FixB family protein [candidate division NC10 bacterium]
MSVTVFAFRSTQEHGEQMTSSVWVILGPGEMPPAPGGLPLLAEARRLVEPAGGVTVVLTGPAAAVEELAAQGATRILVLDAADGGVDPIAAAEVLTERLRDERPETCLLSASRWGSEVAGRLAARLGAALLPGCVGLTRDGAGRLEGVRPVYGSRLVARVAATGGSLPIVTLRPGSESAGGVSGRQPATLERIPCPARPDWIRVLGEEQVPPEALDLGEADVVVAGGLGVGSRQGFALVEELAGLLGGAMGATRMAVDAGWAPFSRQIGLTGRIISPRVYLACGISGSPHHMDGVRQAELVVAINTDRHAPIFTYADVGILGDVREVLPALIATLRRLRPEARDAAALLGGGTGRPGPLDARS